MRLLLGICAAVILASGAVSANYEVKWYSINCGGGTVSNGTYNISCSVGQSAAGFANNVNYLHWIGFWAGDAPDPTVVSSIGAAKLLADNTYVSIAGRVAVSSETDYDGFFYLEESNRSGGIRVAASGSAVSGLARGSVVNVIGTMGTTDAGERQVVGPMVVITSSTTPPAPLGMVNRSVGGGDLGTPPLGQYGVEGGSGHNNVGLLVMTWGRVKYSSSQYMLLDDGSGTQVRVDTTKLALVPAVNDYVSVIGVSSLYKSGSDRIRFVLPRTSPDVKTW